MDVRAYNREAWDRCVAGGDRWTLPVGPEVIAAARRGDWTVVLTPQKPAPRAWFPADLGGKDVLGLAAGGGQQGPILAAAGARVTVYDNAPAQLAQDRRVAAREGLAITTVEGDMRDLAAFADASFDLVVHPCANCFVEDVRPVWREAFRVLRPGGALLAGFCHPVLFLFDPDLEEQGVFQLKYRAPYSDLQSRSEEERRRAVAQGGPLVFGHTLEDQIGGQLDAGFLLAGYYDDRHLPEHRLSDFLPTFGATRAIKP